jgi:hypothetical protein
MLATIQCLQFLRDPQQYRAKRAVLSGLLWGIGILISPSLQPVFIGFTLLEVMRLFPQARAEYARFLALRAAMIALILTPWTIRNYVTFGAICPVRCSFGLEFYVSNNSHAHFDQDRNFSADSEHPTVSVQECLRIIAAGENSYYRSKLNAARDWIRFHPARFAELTALRVVTFWLPWVSASPPLSAIYAAITIAAFAGLIRLRHEDKLAFSIFMVIWILYPLVYYTIQYSTKYRFPIDWTLLLMASFWLAGLSTRMSHPTRKPLRPVAPVSSSHTRSNAASRDKVSAQDLQLRLPPYFRC